MTDALTAESILKQLDTCTKESNFLMLDNGFIYPAAVHLHAYSDGQRWALVIEDLGYSKRSGDYHAGIQNYLSCYGNCLKRPPGIANEDFLFVSCDGPDGPIFTWDGYVGDGVRSICIREHVVELDCSPNNLRGKVKVGTDEPNITPADLLRSLLPEHKDKLLATEEELRQRIPRDLPCILRLEDWHHPDVCRGEVPSQSQAFQMIADALVCCDARKYNASQPPNTRWSNWPGGGEL